MSTVISLYIANMKEFIRDRAAMFWTFAFPIFFIVLFGAIFSGSSMKSEAGKGSCFTVFLPAADRSLSLVA